MGVAAELHVQPGASATREIGRHQGGRPAVERERRDEHAAVADRHQLGHACLVLLPQQDNRIGPVRRRFPIGVDTPRHLGARGLPARRTLVGGEVLTLAGRRLPAASRFVARAVCGLDAHDSPLAWNASRAAPRLSKYRDAPIVAVTPKASSSRRSAGLASATANTTPRDSSWLASSASVLPPV